MSSSEEWVIIRSSVSGGLAGVGLWMCGDRGGI